MQKRFLLLILTFSATLLQGCLPEFKDSPYSDSVQSSIRTLNTQTIVSLSINFKTASALRIGLLSDSHQNYISLSESIVELNRRSDLDFVVILGDFTNSAYNYEYDQYISLLQDLALPSITVIGNHDAIGAGVSMYRKLFGQLNSTLELDNFKFIFFHSNNLEAPKEFSLEWLEAETTGLTKKTYIFTHVSLDDMERFSSDQRSRFQAIQNNPLVEIVFNGHRHVFLYQTPAGAARKLQVPRTEGNQGAEVWIDQAANPRIFQRSGSSLREF